MSGFKTGDVVAHPEFGRGIVKGTYIEWGGGQCADYSRLARMVGTDLRRLVVIDPEDREQVERLAASYLVAVVDVATQPHDIDVSEVDHEAMARAMQAALREFADPKPPRIEEPGTWGVVEASCVHSDRRISWVKHPDGNWWPAERGDHDDWDSLIDPVLIREGVES